MSEIRRKVVGVSDIVEETIKKDYETVNTRTQTIIRKTTKAILLDCGHKIRCTDFPGKIPTNNTRCYECERGPGDVGADMTKDQEEAMGEIFYENGYWNDNFGEAHLHKHRLYSHWQALLAPPSHKG